MSTQTIQVPINTQKRNKNRKNKKQNKSKQNGKKTKKNGKNRLRPLKLMVKGQGDYSLSGMGESIGSRLGGLAGKSLGGLISSVTGFGDYEVKSNTLLTQTPDFTNHAFTNIVHKEFVGDVFGQKAFTKAARGAITPINNEMFPWLSKMARCWDEYQINGLLFHYKPTSGVAVGSTSTAIGYVIMSTQYNPYDAEFSSKQAIENYQYTTSSAPYTQQLHAVECDPTVVKQPILSVLGNASIGDKRFTDFGIFNIYTGGGQLDPSQVWGELWVTYDITFYKKASRPLSLADHYRGDSGITASLPMGVVVTIDPQSTLNSSFSGNVLTIPASFYGYLNLIYSYTATAADATNALVCTLSTSITAVNEFNNDSASTVNGYASSNAIFQRAFNIVAGGTITLTIPSLSITGPISADLMINEMPYLS